MNNIGWWRNSRGEYYVIVQALLMLLVLLGPRIGSNAWRDPWSTAARVAGSVLGTAGLLLCIAGTLSLGRRNLSPLPHPKSGATLVQSGAYSIVRHPIYSGLTLAAVGWAFAWRSPVALGFAVVLLLFFDMKSRREELWLERTFSEYGDYRRRVKKLIPFLY